ncbi:MAG: V-type ATP synthase subunit E family protein [Candidatus Paceibacterota bacterium]
MALPDITQKILDEADRRVKEIQNDTAEEVAEIERETREKKDALKHDYDQALERDKDHLRRQARSHAEQAKKRAVETSKRQHIDRVFTEVTERLAKLPRDAYQALITSLLQELPSGTRGTLYAPATRIAETDKALATAGIRDLSLEEDVSMTGGFRITGASADYDYSFERLVEDARDEHELTVAQTLFPTT